MAESQELSWKDRMVEMGERLHEVPSSIDKRTKQLEMATREHPKTALGAAFLVGLAIGGLAAITASRSRRKSPGEAT